MAIYSVTIVSETGLTDVGYKPSTQRVGEGILKGQPYYYVFTGTGLPSVPSDQKDLAGEFGDVRVKDLAKKIRYRYVFGKQTHVLFVGSVYHAAADSDERNAKVDVAKVTTMLNTPTTDFTKEFFRCYLDVTHEVAEAMVKEIKSYADQWQIPNDVQALAGQAAADAEESDEEIESFPTSMVDNLVTQAAENEQFLDQLRAEAPGNLCLYFLELENVAGSKCLLDCGQRFNFPQMKNMLSSNLSLQILRDGLKDVVTSYPKESYDLLKPKVVEFLDEIKKVTRSRLEGSKPVTQEYLRDQINGMLKTVMGAVEEVKEKVKEIQDGKRSCRDTLRRIFAQHNMTISMLQFIAKELECSADDVYAVLPTASENKCKKVLSQMRQEISSIDFGEGEKGKKFNFFVSTCLSDALGHQAALTNAAPVVPPTTTVTSTESASASGTQDAVVA